MIFEVVFINHVVNKAGIAVPIITRLRIGKGNVPFEVVVLGLQHIEIFYIEHLAFRAGTIPERNLTLRLQALELIEDV